MATLLGTDGADTLTATSTPVTIFGRRGADLITGSAGADSLFGEGGSDTIAGGDGTDILLGGNGDDVLDGGAGSDALFAGNGDDTLTGGTGVDLFYFGVDFKTTNFFNDRPLTDGGRATITDWEDTIDRLTISTDGGVRDFRDIEVEALGSDTLVTFVSFGGTFEILLIGIAPATIDAADFNFFAFA